MYNKVAVHAFLLNIVFLSLLVQRWDPDSKLHGVVFIACEARFLSPRRNWTELAIQLSSAQFTDMNRALMRY